jgi:hypothetical protein
LEASLKYGLEIVEYVDPVDIANNFSTRFAVNAAAPYILNFEFRKI